MNSPPSPKDLETTFRAALNKYGIEPTELKAVSGSGLWLLDLVVCGRKFRFGRSGREGYSFSEIKDGVEIMFMGSDSDPIYASNDYLWYLSVDIIRAALKDPNYRG
jgi:hypothetical protein